MKIICNNVGKVGGYIQVKDLKYLGIVYRRKGLLLRYKAFLSNGKKLTDFVRVVDTDTLSLLINDDYVVDFLQYKDKSSFEISTEIVLRMSFLGDQYEKLAASQVTEDLRDILAFIHGNLEYTIPIVPTDRIVFISGDLRFSSTSYDNVYMLKCSDREENVMNYLNYCMKSVLDMDYDGEQFDYSIVVDNDDYLIINVNASKKKRKIFGKRK